MNPSRRTWWRTSKASPKPPPLKPSVMQWDFESPAATVELVLPWAFEPPAAIVGFVPPSLRIAASRAPTTNIQKKPARTNSRPRGLRGRLLLPGCFPLRLFQLVSVPSADGILQSLHLGWRDRPCSVDSSML